MEFLILHKKKIRSNSASVIGKRKRVVGVHFKKRGTQKKKKAIAQWNGKAMGGRKTMFVYLGLPVGWENKTGQGFGGRREKCLLQARKIGKGERENERSFERESQKKASSRETSDGSTRRSYREK